MIYFIENVEIMFSWGFYSMKHTEKRYGCGFIALTKLK